MEGRKCTLRSWTSCPVSESGERAGWPAGSAPFLQVASGCWYFFILFYHLFLLYCLFFFFVISCCYWMAAPEGGPAAPSAVIWLGFNNSGTKVRCGPELSRLYTHTHTLSKTHQDKDGSFTNSKSCNKSSSSCNLEWLCTHRRLYWLKPPKASATLLLLSLHYLHFFFLPPHAIFRAVKSAGWLSGN